MIPAFHGLGDCSFAAPGAVCALALLATVLWGLTPVIVKYSLSLGGTKLQAVVVVLAVDTAVLWLATGLRHGLDAVFALPGTALLAFALTGVLATAVGRLVVYTGIERLGASVNTTCLGVRPLFAALLGVAVLGEWIGSLTLVGVFVLALGVVVLGRSKGGDVEGWRRWELLFPLAGAAIYALANGIRRTGLRETAVPPLAAVTVNETVALAVILGYVVVRRRGGELLAPRKTYVLLTLAGVATAVGMAAIFTALGHPGGRVVVVDPLVATAPLFTTGFAVVFLRDAERVTRGVAMAAAIVVTGGILVILG